MIARIFWRLAVALVLAGGAAPAGAEEQKCHLMEAAHLDMSTDITGRVNVPMTVGGQTVNMLIDTAGFISTLTRYSVSSLNLRSESAFRPLETYYGGEVVDHYVTARDVALGRLKASKLGFFVMSNSRTSDDVGGTLAPDILGAYDVEFDFAHGTFRLFSKDHCEGEVVYWTQGGFGEVAFRMNDAFHIVVPVVLNGREVQATIDTGAADTVARLERIESHFDIDEKNPNLQLIPGRNPKKPHYRYPFKSLAFGEVAVTNPDITLVPDEESKLDSRDETIILGMNVLRHLHLYIAYGEKKLYVTPATAH